MAKKFFSKALSVGLSLVLCVSLAMPGFAASFAELQGVIDNQQSLINEETNETRIGYEDGKVTLYENVTHESDEGNKRVTFSGEDINITLDLNGKTIDGNGEVGVIAVNKGASLTIEDSSETGGGKITGGQVAVGGGIIVNGRGESGKGSELTINGGEITGNEATLHGGGVVVDPHTKFTMNGGKITGNTSAGSGGGVNMNSQAEFTMNGGEISGNTSGNCGGGVEVIFESTFTMNGGKITGNEATHDGGGVGVGQDGTFVMNNGEISGNEGAFGGGVANSGSTTMNGGEISGNSAVIGGGIASIKGDVTVSAGTISGNEAENEGGGIYAAYTETEVNGEISGNNAANGGGIQAVLSDVTLKGNAQINGNTTEMHGGGVNIQQGSLTMEEGAVVSGNTGNMGGGIFAHDVEAEINGEVSDNTAHWGGGLYAQGGSEAVIGGKVSGNTVDQNGGGIYITGSKATLNGGEITGNSADKTGGGVVSASNSEFTMTAGAINNNSAAKADDIHSQGSKLTLIEAAGTLNSDNKPITGWYFDGGEGWGSNGQFGYYSQDQAVVGVVCTGTASLKAAHDQYFQLIDMDGNVRAEVEKGTMVDVSEFEKPTLDGFAFVGWTVNGELVEGPFEVTGEVELGVRWELIPTNPPETEITDPEVPLAAGPVTRAEFVDYLWRHEGEPAPAEDSGLFEDVTEEHEYSPAMAWAKSIGIIEAYEDGTFEPDELVTVSAVRDILTRFAAYAGMTMPELTTLTGDEDEAVLNCDEVLAEFFGEEYVPAQDEESEVAA